MDTIEVRDLKLVDYNLNVLILDKSCCKKHTKAYYCEIIGIRVCEALFRLTFLGNKGFV